MSIPATYIAANQFSVTGNREENLGAGQKITCRQAPDSPVTVTVSSRSYSGGVTTITVEESTVTSNLATIEPHPSDTESTAKHTHAESPAWGLSSNEVATLQTIPLLEAGNPLKFLRYNSADDAIEAVTVVGSSNQILGTNAAGNDVENKTISGTAKQVTVTHGAGTITLSGPQDLDTVDSPEFAGLTVGSGTGNLKVASGVVSVGTLVEELANLSDVGSVVGSPSGGDTLYYDGGNTEWRNLAKGTDTSYFMRQGASFPEWSQIEIQDLSDANASMSDNATRGDVIYYTSSGEWDRLPIGLTGKVLMSDGTDAGWDYVDLGDLSDVDATVTSAGAQGDMLVRGASDYGRVAIGAADTVMKSNGTTAAWGNVDVDELGNVNVSGITDGQILYWDNASSTWLPKTEAGAGSGMVPTLTVTAGETLSQYDTVYLDSTDSGEAKKGQADGTEAEAEVLGLITESGGIADTSAGELTWKGPVSNGSWSWTPGGKVYLSTTAGGLTQTKPSTSGHYVVEVGTAITATSINLDIKAGYQVP